MKNNIKLSLRRNLAEKEVIIFFKKNISNKKEDIKNLKMDIKYFCWEQLYLVMLSKNLIEFEKYINADNEMNCLEKGIEVTTYTLGNANESFKELIIAEQFD